MKFINFNNAGSSFATSSTIRKINSYLQKEKIYGGYKLSEIFKKQLNDFYINTSKLINCRPSEISFIQNATYGWNFFVDSISIKKSNNVIIFDNEYGSNHIKILKKRFNTKVINLKDGDFAIEELKKKIDENTKLVSICHISSQCGDVMNVEKLGSFLKNKNIFFLVDACQSIGQVEINVKNIFCDALVCSGRKYLRGPRGTGFIYVRNEIQNKLNPSILDMKKCKVEQNKLEIFEEKNIFEVFEYSPALKIGFSNSISEINKIGIKKIEKKIIKFSRYFRSKLENFPEVIFYENKKKLSGLNTFNIKGLKPKNISKLLYKKKILCSISNFQTSTLHFKNKKQKEVLRISFHYYNKFSEIDYLVECLIDLIKNK